jgi:hypothetical protein
MIASRHQVHVKKPYEPLGQRATGTEHQEHASAAIPAARRLWQCVVDGILSQLRALEK